jgi:hypothetical protein
MQERGGNLWPVPVNAGLIGLNVKRSQGRRLTNGKKPAEADQYQVNFSIDTTCIITHHNHDLL